MNTYFLTAARDMVFNSKQSLLQNQASVIASSLTVMDDLNVDNVSQVMSVLDVTDITGISVRDVGGDIYYDTIDLPDSGFGSHDVRFLTALNGSTGYYGHFIDGAFKCFYYMPLVMKGRTAGVLILYDIDVGQGAFLLNLQNSIRIVSLVVSIVYVIIAVILVWTITMRLNKIRRGLVPIGEGQYHSRIHMSGSDEFSELAAAFDDMSDRLEETEAIRRRFVADASHELKTPIASIRLLSDSILQTEGMDRETTQEFVADINHEAERLAHITEHLLTLTRLDTQAKVERSPVDLAEVARRILHMLQPIASAREISLSLEASGPCYISALPDELNQLVQNLTENAIKYNVDGGQVSVELAVRGNQAQLTVADTGIGIPDEDLPRIFDRFYRVDKARSREAGGTGLGLSIVKGIVHNLGGSIEAAPRLEGGMLFTVTLPLIQTESNE
ncbi:MAG: HAMP domain-containing histidine kinase [Oscillospiraceae bacterium]|nr:HAMP domain-containing histidine kinase [Oscillospiraceae bacterium]